MRPVLVALCVCLVVAAPSFAGADRAAQVQRRFVHRRVQGRCSPGRERGSLAAAAGRGCRPGARAGTRRQRDLRLPARARGLRRSVARQDRAQALAANPRVAYVEPDQVVYAFPAQTPATWGLDRIDQRDLPLNNTYNYNQTGQSVHAYVLDTGIRDTHPSSPAAWGTASTSLGTAGHQGLSRPWHARGRHCGRHHLWRGQGGDAPRGARAGLHGQRRQRSRCSPASTGSPPTTSRRGEHEPRRRRELGAGQRRQQLDQLRRQLRSRRGQFERQRVQLSDTVPLVLLVLQSPPGRGFRRSATARCPAG